MTQAIVNVSAPAKVILFGSRARGTAHQHSDYDFLVIDSGFFGEGRSRLHVIAQISQALTKFGVSKDILLYSTEEVEQRRHWRSGVIAQALKEGQLLYEKP